MTLVGPGHVGYGHGLFIHDGFRLEDGYHAVTLIEHGGDIPGFATSVFYVPSTGFGFITLASADGAHLNESAAYALAQFAELGAAVTPPADLAIDPATFASLAGDYLDELNAGRITITADASAVTIAMPDVEAAGIPYQPALMPIGPDRFLLSIQGSAVDLTFLRDAGGAPRYLRSRAFVARRGAGTARPRRVPHFSTYETSQPGAWAAVQAAASASMPSGYSSTSSSNSPSR